MTYKQYFYKTKQKEIDDSFIKYLVPVMEDIENPELIEEWIKILMLLLMKKYLYKDEKLSSLQKKIDRNDKTECCLKSIV